MKRLFLLIQLCIVSIVQAQIQDTNTFGVIQGNGQPYYDSSLTIDNFYRLNENNADEFGVISMGNQGDIRRRLVFANLATIQPNLGIDGYFKNFKPSQDLPYYRVKAPSSGVRYQSGYLRGQFFGLDFTINPRPNSNIYIDFQRNNSTGRYFNQENKVDKLNFTTYYYTPSGKYQILAGLSWNKSKNAEFGGIADVEQFEENTQGNRELITVNLLQSASVARSADLLLDQSFRLLGKMEQGLSVNYKFRLKDDYYSFITNDTLFTNNALFEDGLQRDSISLKRLENELGFTWVQSNLELFGGLNHFYYAYGNDYLKTVENTIGVLFKAKYALKKLSTTGRLDYFLTEQYAGTYDLNLSATYNLNKKSSLSAYYRTYSVRPGLFNQRFISNNFVWNNDFHNIRGFDFQLGYHFHFFEFSAGMNQFDNWVYFNQQAISSQFNGVSNVYYAELKGILPISKSWYLDNSVRYQSVNQDEIIRIPNWVLRHTLFYQKDIFNRKARIQTGVEFNYFSAFKSEQYLPATSVMFLQDDVTIGNFPYFNFLFNFRIQTFTFFVRLENITEGLFEYNYYAAPFYPLPDFSFRVGATWRFFN